MAGRLTKRIFYLLCFVAVSFGIVHFGNMAIENLVLSDFDVYASPLVFTPRTEVGYYLMKALFYVLYNETVRIIVIALLVVSPYCHYINERAYAPNGISAYWNTIGKVRMGIDKVIKFSKPGWFWALCFFTSFLPILIPLVIWIILRLAFFLISMAIEPILYLITQISYTYKGSIG